MELLDVLLWVILSGAKKLDLDLVVVVVVVVSVWWIF